MPIQRLLIGVAVAGALTSCAGEGDPSPEAVPAAPARVGPAEELGTLFDDARLAFRASGQAFKAHHDTHAALVQDGALSVTPYHFDGEENLVGAPVQFATASIQRGDLALDAAAGEARVVDRGSLEIDRGSAVEVLDNREDGVEQSWRFAGAPDGEGDLVVAVNVSGHQTVESSRTGLHFHTPGRLGVAYSNAYWIDARGTSWNVPVAWDGAQVVMRVPGSVIDQSAYPAMLDPVIGPETATDAATTGATGARAREPQVSFNGNTYLMVWRDDRTGIPSEIYAARVRQDGSIIDLHGRVIANDVVLEAEPVVAWTGSVWVVAWTEDNGDGGDIAAATVASGGAVTQLGVIANTLAIEFEPSIAGDGTGALLAWQANAGIRGAVFSGGAFGVPFNIAFTAVTEGRPTVAASSAGNYLVAWQQGADEHDIRGRRVVNGVSTGVVFPISATDRNETLPAAAFNGTDYVVAYRDNGNIGATGVTTAGVATTSVVVSENGFEQTNAQIACDSNSCLVAWEDRRDTTDPDAVTFGVYGQRLNDDLTLAGGEITISDELRGQIRPGLAAQNAGFMAAWEDNRTGSSNVMASPITTGGVVSIPAGTVINLGANNSQRAPAYSRGPAGHIALWSDSRNLQGDDIMSRRYNANGGRLDSAARVVSNAIFEQGDPVADFDGTQHLAVWMDARNPSFDIYAARVLDDGTLVDPTGFPITNAIRAQTFPDVASGGGASLVVWQDFRTIGNSYDLFGAIVTPGGTVSVPDIAICEEADEQTRPAVAWDPNGSVFVVVWGDRRATDPEDTADLYAARVAPDGTVLDPCGVLVAGAVENQFFPDIATSGGQLLAVWDERSVDLLGDVFAARLTTSGNALNVLDPGGFAVGSGVSAQSSPTVVGLSGDRFAVAWVDDITFATNGTDIYGATLNADGSLFEPNYAISTTPESESAPSFQAGVNSLAKVYLVYQKLRVDIGNVRIRRRAITY